MTEYSDMYAGTDVDTREYDAVAVATFNRALALTGVCHGLLNELEVLQHGAGDQSVDVDTGFALVYGNMVLNDALLNLAVNPNTSGNPRIDRVILRNTTATDIDIVILEGTPDPAPTPPALTQDSTTYEISLAQLYLANAYTQILTADITDERDWSTMGLILSSALCQFDADLDMDGEAIEDVGTPGYNDDTALINKGLYDDDANFANLPPGIIMSFGNATMPGGFLRCDGSAVSRTTYAAIFAVIGTTFGVGDGSTTFNLPLMTDRVPVGQDTGDADFNTIGATGGAATVTLDETQMAIHTHGDDYFTTSTLPTRTGTPHGSVHNGDTTSGLTGGDGAHNNLAPYLKLSYGIKV